MLQNSKTLIRTEQKNLNLTKLQNFKCDQTKKKLKIVTNSKYDKTEEQKI